MSGALRVMCYGSSNLDNLSEVKKVTLTALTIVIGALFLWFASLLEPSFFWPASPAQLGQGKTYTYTVGGQTYTGKVWRDYELPGLQERQEAKGYIPIYYNPRDPGMSRLGRSGNSRRQSAEGDSATFLLVVGSVVLGIGLTTLFIRLSTHVRPGRLQSALASAGIGCMLGLVPSAVVTALMQGLLDLSPLWVIPAAWGATVVACFTMGLLGGVSSNG